MLNKIIVFGLIAIFTLISTLAYSQKCKYSLKRKDPITGKEKKAIICFDIQNRGRLVLVNDDNHYFFVMCIMHEGNIADLRNPDNSINFKLENGESITISKNEIKEKYIKSFFDVYFSISDYDLHKIASSPLTDIKISVGSYKIDESYSVKKGKSFQNKAKCILQ